LDRFGTSCGGSGTAPVPNFIIAPLTEEGLGPGGYDFYQEAFLTLQPDSSLAFFDWDHPNRYNYGPVNFYMRPDERWSVGAFADFEIHERAVVYLETMGTSDRTRAQIAESGTFFYEAYLLPLSNAYFPENFRNSLEALWPGEDEFGIYVGKRNVEGGPRSDIMEHNSLRVVAGLRGVLAADWDYDISYLHAQTASSSTYVNDFLAPPLATAVDSRLCETTPGCIPYQVFTYQGVTEAAARSVTGTAIATANTATTIFQGYVTGSFGWGLPAGDIMAAAGYEHRREEFERLPDMLYEEGLLLGQGFKLLRIAGAYAVDELFMELNVPLLANRAFARNMTLDLAYRWSDYSSSGASSTYRAGLDWQVVDWLRLRTGYNRAVRSPNVEELYQPQQISGTNAVDHCEGPQPAYTFEQCARTGVTAEQYGHIPELPDPDLWGYQFLYGGNPDLDPEEADTVTAGLVVEPMDAMRLSIDYWDIRIEGVIEGMDTNVILDQCALDGQLCELVHRGANGTLWLGKDAYLIGIYWNLGEQHSNGIDVAWDWSPGDHWRFNLIGTYYLKQETTAIPNDPDTRWDCAGIANDYYCWAKTPEWRHIATATYDSGGAWALTGRWRYFGEIDYTDETDQIAGDNLKAQNYLDLSAVIRFMDTHDLSLGVNNLLDREPPLLGAWQSSQANTVAGFYDTLGRFVFANVTFRW
jgi:outer membrane receptor protein involved in Fe transport